MYTLPSSYLQNIGFFQKANCAIALMKSIPAPSGSNLDDFEKNEVIQNERDKAFELVIQQGMKALKKFKGFSKFSEEDLREYVYQSLMLSQQYLVNILASMKAELEKGGDGSNFNSADLFGIYYLKANCKSELNFDISKG